jgi:predicted CxxxxCH...CXXCH cytochrome family protein
LAFLSFKGRFETKKRRWVVKMSKWGFVVSVFFFTLFISATPGYSHTISASAGPGGSIWPFGPINVADGADQTFTITPDAGYEILEVVTDSGSLGPVSTYTFTNVTADDFIIASFSACPDPSPVMLESDGLSYNTIMEAYGVANPLGDTILLKAGTFPDQDLLFNQDLSILLDGGKDCSFQDNSMFTNIRGSLTIAAGSVIPSDIAITSSPACQPGDPINFPTNPEICDGLDNDCDGVADNGLSFDNDHDGYTAIGSCGGSADDCNDNNPNIHPFGEIYGDGIDQDCDGADLLFPIDTECYDCHLVDDINYVYHQSVAAPDNTCVNCHAPQVNTLLPGHYGQTVRTTSISNNMSAGDVIHCTSCHDWHDEELTGFYPPGGADIVWEKIYAVPPGYPNNKDNLTCDACHEDRAALHATDTAHDHRVIDNSCAQCHYPLSTQADIDTLHRSDCTLCHNYTGTKIWPRTVEQAIENGMNGTDITCTDCHKVHHSGTDNKVSYNPLVDTSQSSQQGCADCHHDYDTVNGTSLGLSTWETILVEHDLDGTKDGSTNACSTCHAYDGSGSPPLSAVQGAIANSSPDTCASCHTDKVPNVDHGIPTSGKHEEHFAIANLSCGTCHYTGNIPCFKSGTDSNGDGCYDLSETDVCYTCHQDGSGNPADDAFKDGWYDPDFVLACDGCHALAPPTGTHSAHYNGTDPTLVYGDLRTTEDFTGGQVSSVNMIGCGNCHPIDSLYHVNGAPDVELANIAAPAGSLKALSPNGSYDPNTGTCSNVYCHSANSWTTDGPVPMPWPDDDPYDDPLPRPLPDNIITTRVYQNVTWNSGVTLTCNGCHQNPPQTSYVDNDGGAGDSHYWVDSYGYENLHVWNMGYVPIDCRTCHYDTIHDNSTGYVDPETGRRVYNNVALYDKAKHVNGTVDVAFDTVNEVSYAGVSGPPIVMDMTAASFDPVTQTCSNVECHLQETEVKWGVPFRWYNSADCNPNKRVKK